jgi:hypothetical protein
MAATFISYRRDDAAGYAGRLHESLERRLGASHLFRDVDTLEPGQDFVKAIDARLAACKVMLVIIGREWLDARNAAGTRRLDDPFDFVRLEIAAGLARPDVVVVPVLVEGASMPAASQLPDNMQALARRHAVSVRDETWDADVDRLAAVVFKVVPPPASLDGVARALRPKTFAAVAGAIAVLVALALWMPSRGPSGEPSPAAVPTSTSTSPSAAPATSGGAAGAPYTIDIPRIAEAAFGNIIYSLVSGNVAFRETDNDLRLRIRVSNFGGNAINFWDDSFRLAAGGQTVAPVSGLNAIVDRNSLQYGVVAFRIPRRTRNATLQIINGRNIASIPIDLTPTGRLPVDEQAEIADSLSQAIRESVIKEAAPLLSADGMTVTLDRASSRRFANALRLILSVRVVNSGTGPVFAGNIIMRVGVGDVIIVPVEWPFLAIDPQSMATENVAFDLPTSTTQATLRTTIGRQSAEFPVRVSK